MEKFPVPPVLARTGLGMLKSVAASLITQEGELKVLHRSKLDRLRFSFLKVRSTVATPAAGGSYLSWLQGPQSKPTLQH